MPTVYLETTIPSYLAAKPSRDLIVAANQQITHEWWETARERFELFVSEVVLEEIQKGDSEAAALRVQLVQDVSILKMNPDVRKLVRLYDRHLGLPPKARADVQHIAFAVAHRLDYLVTWNRTHIANGEVVKRLSAINRKHRRSTPLIITPQELLVLPEGGEL